MVTSPQRTALAAIAICVPLSWGCEKKVENAAPPPPPEVYVSDVVQQDVPIYLELPGQTVGNQDVEIRARVEGFLDSMNFRGIGLGHAGNGTNGQGPVKGRASRHNE